MWALFSFAPDVILARDGVGRLDKLAGNELVP
jgi:hypothetical protein